MNEAQRERGCGEARRWADPHVTRGFDRGAFTEQTFPDPARKRVQFFEFWRKVDACWLTGNENNGLIAQNADWRMLTRRAIVMVALALPLNATCSPTIGLVGRAVDGHTLGVKIEGEIEPGDAEKLLKIYEYFRPGATSKVFFWSRGGNVEEAMKYCIAHFLVPEVKDKMLDVEIKTEEKLAIKTTQAYLCQMEFPDYYIA